jgi:hypothetical protein
MRLQGLALQRASPRFGYRSLRSSRSWVRRHPAQTASRMPWRVQKKPLASAWQRKQRGSAAHPAVLMLERVQRAARQSARAPERAREDRSGPDPTGHRTASSGTTGRSGGLGCCQRARTYRKWRKRQSFPAYCSWRNRRISSHERHSPFQTCPLIGRSCTGVVTTVSGPTYL